MISEKNSFGKDVVLKIMPMTRFVCIVISTSFLRVVPINRNFHDIDQTEFIFSSLKKQERPKKRKTIRIPNQID